MNKIYVKAMAKINLTLNVLNKREDGYHELKSIMKKINLYDELYIEKNDSNDINIKMNIDNIEKEKNILYKTYMLLKEKYDISGVNVILTKKIPMQAGLGGGSADAADFILAMNKLFNLNLSEEEMFNIGKNIGADVNPCIVRKTSLAEGIGDKITKINDNSKLYVVIIKPKIACSTKEMFEVLDEESTVKNEDKNQELQTNLEKKNIFGIVDNLYNDFEIITDRYKEIIEVKNDLAKTSALKSMLSGSGSCVFGIYESKEKAKEAYHKLKKKYEAYYVVTF